MNHSSPIHYRSRPALALVLLAALLSTLWLGVEAGHFHDSDDSVIECLLCKGPADTPAAPGATAPLAAHKALVVFSSAASVLPCAPFSHYLSRGPPHYS